MCTYLVLADATVERSPSLPTSRGPCQILQVLSFAVGLEWYCCPRSYGLLLCNSLSDCHYIMLLFVLPRQPQTRSQSTKPRKTCVNKFPPSSPQHGHGVSNPAYRNCLNRFWLLLPCMEVIVLPLEGSRSNKIQFTSNKGV